MKLKKILTGMACVALGATLVACDDGESSDPATASRGDLNPPGTLETITGDSQLTLWWTAGNVEEEFKGYYVFAAKEATPGTYTYPKQPDGTAPNVKTVGIPRCADNTAFFQQFGLPETDRECEDAQDPAEGDADADAEAFALQDDGDEGGEDEGSVDVDEPLTNWIPCVNDSGESVSADLSMPGTAPVVTPQACTIKKYYDAEKEELADMVNGDTYMFFVVAVMGDDLSQISWTTPLVSDTPSLDVIPQKDIVIGNFEYAVMTIDTSTMTADIDPAEACEGSNACTLSTPNSEPVSGHQIFIGRQVDDPCSSPSKYCQRLFISGSTAGTVAVQPRGPQTAYGDTTGATRIPGDEAASTYPAAGTKYVVYENQIFDFKITDSGTDYYGKVHIDTVSFADGSETGDATLKVAAVLQTQAGETQYVTFQ